jgi:hypothetical protein
MSHSKLNIIFEKIHESFINDLNKVSNLELKYEPSFDVISSTLDIKKLVVDDPFGLELKDFEEFEAVKGVKLSSYISKITSLNSVRTFFIYIKVFAVLIEIINSKLSTTDEDKFIIALQHARKGNDFDFECDNDNVIILLDNICKLSTKSSNNEESETTDDNDDKGDEMPINMSILENSKIGKLAKEISEELDLSSIKSMDDVAKFTDPSNNFINDIVSKVGSKINNKLSNGELKQDDLLSEALNLMNSFGGKAPGNMGDIFNNPMMKSVLNSLGNNKGSKSALNVGKMRSMSARDRLRSKLKAKQKNNDNN